MQMLKINFANWVGKQSRSGGERRTDEIGVYGCRGLHSLPVRHRALACQLAKHGAYRDGALELKALLMIERLKPTYPLPGNSKRSTDFVDIEHLFI